MEIPSTDPCPVDTEERDALADLYAVGNALAELAESLDEKDSGHACILRLLAREVQECTERVDNAERRSA